MPDRLLSNLPPLDKSSGGMSFARNVKPAPEPKSAFSVPKVKQVTKLLEGLGKQVTGVTVQADGFTVTASTPGLDPATEPNPWDKVLPK